MTPLRIVASIALCLLALYLFLGSPGPQAASAVVALLIAVTLAFPSRVLAVLRRFVTWDRRLRSNPTPFQRRAKLAGQVLIGASLLITIFGYFAGREFMGWVVMLALVLLAIGSTALFIGRYFGR